jgi:twinkle protein
MNDINFVPDDIDFAQYLKDTDSSEFVRKADLWIDELKATKTDKTDKKKIYLPWPKTQKDFDFRMGEVTLWSGQNGHGKSLITSQIALSLIGQDQKVCIASFEMKPITTLKRMARQYIGMNPDSPEFDSEEGDKTVLGLYDEFGGWISKWLWFYDQQGSADTDTVLGMVKYCAQELEIKHIFVDSLMKCVKGEDDYNGQKYFIDTITAIARDFNCHIHIVHHLRKPRDENEIPDKHDNKGSGSITDQVDNVMMVWRNKRKEDDVKAKGLMSNHKTEPDAMLLCRKQRNGEEEPSIYLWYNKDSQQYVEAEGLPPMVFYAQF